MDKSLHYRGV